MKLPQDLLRLLIDINLKKGNKFSGLGLVMYKSVKELPIVPLKIIDEDIQLPITPIEIVTDFLIKVSNSNNKYHDGFHLLNKSLELTHIAQYLAPKIVKLNIKEEFGSRYRTAIYTSLIPDVIACGVLSKNYPPTVFVKGLGINL
jgi:DisA bacterial checkpoint controller nucleotide-binding